MIRFHRSWILLPCVSVLLPGLTGCGEAEPVPETSPQRISESTFDYPEDLWDADIEGRTMLRVFVTEAGQVDSVRVEQASEHAAFDTAAVRGAFEMRFEPARRGEEPMATWVLIPIHFDKTNAAAGPRRGTSGPTPQGQP
jgi:periplasmic protein TonB